MNGVTEHGSAFYIVGLIVQSTELQSYHVDFTTWQKVEEEKMLSPF